MGAAALQGQRSAGRVDARGPDAEYAGRIPGESSGSAVEHAEDICAADGIGVVDRVGSDWSDAEETCGAGSAAGTDV